MLATSLLLLASLTGQITLDETFPAEVRPDLETIAREVLAAVQARMSGDPPAGVRPLVCTVNQDTPITDSTTDPAIYRIGLTVKERYYAQFVFQLSHELGHVMLDPRRTNGLLETLAVAVSLQALDNLAQKWAAEPPYPNWTDYAQHFTKYRQDTEASYLAQFPEEVQDAVRDEEWDDVALYLRYRRADQDRSANDRALNCLGAMALRSGELSWTDFIGVAGHTVPTPAEDGHFRSDLPLDLSKLPQSVRRFGRARPDDFLSARFDAMPKIDGGFLFRDGQEWVWLYESPDLTGQKLDLLLVPLAPIEYAWERGTR